MKTFPGYEEPSTRWSLVVCVVTGVLLTVGGAVYAFKGQSKDFVPPVTAKQELRPQALLQQAENAQDQHQNEHVPTDQIKQETLAEDSLPAVKPPRPPETGYELDTAGEQRAADIASRPRAKVFSAKPAVALKTESSPGYNENGYKVAPSEGYTPTGLPLYVGPKGGVYHMSKNGNKVYEKRK